MANSQLNPISESLHALNDPESNEGGRDIGVMKGGVTEENIRAILLKNLNGDPKQLAQNYEDAKAFIDFEFKKHQKANASHTEESRKDLDEHNLAMKDAAYQFLKRIHYELVSDVELKVMPLPEPPIPPTENEWVVTCFVSVVLSVVLILYPVYQAFNQTFEEYEFKKMAGFFTTGCVLAFIGYKLFRAIDFSFENSRVDYATKYEQWVKLKEEIELEQKVKKIRSELSQVSQDR